MAKKKPSGGTPAPKKAGRPGPGNRKIVPNDYDKLGRMYGTGATFQQMADEFGVAIKTVTDHFKNNIFPMIQASSTRSLEAELLKIDILERIAWECFWSDEPSETRESVKEQLEAIAAARGGERKKAEKILERTATKIHSGRNSKWMDIVKWCIEIRCRLEGHFAPSKVKVKIEEYRVAGQSPAAGMEAMMDRITKKVQERREYEDRLNKMTSEMMRPDQPNDN